MTPSTITAPHTRKARNLRPRLAAVSLAVGLALAAGAPALASQDSKGTDFWLMFNKNFTSTPTLTLFITGDTATTGTVTIPGLGISTPFSVTPGTVTSVPITSTAEVTTADGIQDKGIRVTAGAEVTVYGLNRISATTDAFLGLPTDILGTEYINLGYNNSSLGS